MIGDFRFHRRRDAWRFVDPAKIVEREPQRDRCPVVLPFVAVKAFGKRVWAGLMVWAAARIFRIGTLSPGKARLAQFARWVGCG